MEGHCSWANFVRIVRVLRRHAFSKQICDHWTIQFWCQDVKYFSWTLHAAFLSVYLSQLGQSDIETCSAPWQVIVIGDAIRFVKWQISILQTRKLILMTSAKMKKWYYYSTVIFTEVNWWKFHLHVTSTTIEIWKWSVSLEIWMWVLHTICFKNTNGNYFDFKMFLRKFGALGQSFIMIPWNMLQL